jgi:hypothetical protein
MPVSSTTRLCLFCEKALRGRSDKKFCDDYCRASHNNELRGPTPKRIRSINNQLNKNRRILEGLLVPGSDKGKTHRNNLLEKGFMFQYHTHIKRSKNGQPCFYCYDYGYLSLQKNWYLIWRTRESE